MQPFLNHATGKYFYITLFLYLSICFVKILGYVTLGHYQPTLLDG